MRALLLQAPRDLVLVDLPRPELTAGQVRVRVRKVGVCGSDYSSIAGKLPFTRYPIVPGHEASGEVIESAGDTPFPPGARVVIHPILGDRHDPVFARGDVHHSDTTEVLGVVSRNGAYAEEVVVEDYMLRPAPAGVDDETAAMVEPVAVAVRALERAGLRAGERVLVLGAGNIGLLVIQVARAMCAGRIVVTDVAPARLRAARQLGFEETVDVRAGFPVPDFEKSFDIVIDGVACEQTVSDAVVACARGGRIVVYGVPPGEIRLPLKAAFAKDLVLATSRLYDADFTTALGLIAAGKIRTGELITHRVGLADAPGLIARVLEGSEPAIKVMITP